MSQCRVALNPVFLSANCSGWNSPFGYQLQSSQTAEFLLIAPGISIANGLAANQDLGIRIYAGSFVAANSWNQGVLVAGNTPIYAQVAASPSLIQWGTSLNIYLEFYYPEASVLPANSYVEISLRPFN